MITARDAGPLRRRGVITTWAITLRVPMPTQNAVGHATFSWACHRLYPEGGCTS